jgi:hypothetical protein
VRVEAVAGAVLDLDTVEGNVGVVAFLLVSEPSATLTVVSPMPSPYI